MNQLTDEEYYNASGALEKTISYSYDKLGNRKTKSVTAGGTSTLTTYGYNAANELTSIDGVPLEPYKDGNQRSDGNHNFAFNVMGRLLRVYTPDWANVEMEYEYNADGLRVAKKDKNGKVERYVYNGGKLAYITDGAGNVRFFFTRSTSGALLNMIDYTGASPVTYWYIKDAHGNVIGLGDKDGNIVASYEYDAWGNVLSATGTGLTNDGQELAKANPFRYSSYFYDEETGLYYLKARYYSPELGRFLSMDPVSSKDDGLSSNRYLYARNNPVTLIDSNGLMPGTEDVDSYNVLAERLPKGDPLDTWQPGGTIAAGPVVKAMARGISRATKAVARAAKAVDKGAQEVFEGAVKAGEWAMDQPAVMATWLAAADAVYQEVPPLIFKTIAKAGGGFSYYFLMADVGLNASRYNWNPTAFAMASAVDALGFLTVLLAGAAATAVGAPVLGAVALGGFVGTAVYFGTSNAKRRLDQLRPK